MNLGDRAVFPESVFLYINPVFIPQNHSNQTRSSSLTPQA
jgi:hypothetical protein